MEIRVEKDGSCRKLVRIQATADDVKGEYDKVVKAFAKEARLPGFRKGKAPREIIKRQYAEQIKDEVKERLIPILYRKAVDEKKIRTVNIIDISNVDFSPETGISFEVSVDVYPEFKIPKYKKISLKKNKVDVTEDNVESALKRLLENFSRFENVEGRPVKRDDLVMLDYTSTCEGRSVEKIAPGAKGIGEGSDYWMIAGEPELVPGISAGMTGASIGEKRDVQVHFPDDYRITELAGKDAVYHIEIKGIREKVLPELDKELLEKLRVENETELRSRIRDDLLAEMERLEQERLKGEISAYLLKKTSFDLPASILEQETSIVSRNMRDRLAMQGRTSAQIEQEEQSIFETAKKNSTDRLRTLYILNRIAEEENIEVEEKELNDRLGAMGRRYGMSTAQFRAELEKRGSLGGVKEEILADKTLGFILENAKIKN